MTTHPPFLWIAGTMLCPLRRKSKSTFKQSYLGLYPVPQKARIAHQNRSVDQPTIERNGHESATNEPATFDVSFATGTLRRNSIWWALLHGRPRDGGKCCRYRIPLRRISPRNTVQTLDSSTRMRKNNTSNAVTRTFSTQIHDSKSKLKIRGTFEG